jgi:PIN domain nuclease of toxin-antitoxin system
MRLLLDTHTFIWWSECPERLPDNVAEAIGNGDVDVFLSTASVWEMQIKIGLGKLRLSKPLKTVVEEQCAANRIEVLPVLLHHLWALDQLERIHGDHFDRLLVAQAIVEDLVFVTRDRLLERYPVNVLW